MADTTPRPAVPAVAAAGAHALNTPDLPTLNEALGALYDDLSRLRSAADHISESASAAQTVTAAAGKAVTSATGVAVPTQALLDRVEGIDFPSRLDKLDATTAALFTGLQSAQARLETLDRSLRDAHSDLARRADRAAEVAANQSQQLGVQTKLLWAVMVMLIGLLAAVLIVIR